MENILTETVLATFACLVLAFRSFDRSTLMMDHMYCRKTILDFALIF
jgi:hypothetical protein